MSSAARYTYNLLDENVRRFNAVTPQIWQWDDHEVLNNWSPSKDLSAAATIQGKERVPARRTGHSRVSGICADALLEPGDGARVSRDSVRSAARCVCDRHAVLSWAEHIQPTAEQSADTEYLGRPQLEWLKRGLAQSRAAWKVIASDMPIGVTVGRRQR